MRAREAETQAEGEAGSMHRENDVGFDPGSPGSRPGPKAGAKPLRHPGIPVDLFHSSSGLDFIEFCLNLYLFSSSAGCRIYLLFFSLAPFGVRLAFVFEFFPGFEWMLVLRCISPLGLLLLHPKDFERLFLHSH